jgi:predicted transcriptional regulator
MRQRVVIDTNVSAVTIRLPDDKHARLRQLAKHRDLSVNKLMEELATISITEFDAENRFRAMAARGTTEKGLALLDQLDAAFER